MMTMHAVSSALSCTISAFSGACPGMRKDRCAREARPQILINIHLIVKLRHFRHYYRGALDLFIAEP